MTGVVDCIICSKTMRNLMPNGVQPSGGLAFSTKGHYGSAFFDPMDGSSLDIAICDECLANAPKGVSLFRFPALRTMEEKTE